MWVCAHSRMDLCVCVCVCVCVCACVCVIWIVWKIPAIKSFTNMDGCIIHTSSSESLYYSHAKPSRVPACVGPLDSPDQQNPCATPRHASSTPCFICTIACWPSPKNFPFESVNYWNVRRINWRILNRLRLIVMQNPTSAMQSKYRASLNGVDLKVTVLFI